MEMERAAKMDTEREMSRVPSLTSFCTLGLGLAGEERRQAWRSKAMVLELHSNLGGPAWKEGIKGPKPLS